MSQFQQVSGHVFRVDRKRGPVWYAKYRLADGQQVQKLIGPAWLVRLPVRACSPGYRVIGWRDGGQAFLVLDGCVRT